jgi:hypothetical protein
MSIRRKSRRAPAHGNAAALDTLESRLLFTAILWTENFDGLAFGPPQEETTPGDHVWTNVPPAGWVKDDTGVPGYNNPPDNNGVTEWIGWTFPQRDWWATAAADQTRTQFKRASGGIMVADDDEWDDQAHPGDTDYLANELYNAKITSPSIPLTGGVAGTYSIELDSSWRPEGFDDGVGVNNQTGIIQAVYDTGTSEDILHFDSDGPPAGHPAGPFFHPDAQNEHLKLPLNVPAGATSVKLVFMCNQAANDWWWAVDNVALTATPDVSNVRLIGVSSTAAGGPAANNESLFDITYTTGGNPSVTATKFLQLPSIPDEDAVAFNPASGLLHHASGGQSASDDPADPRYRDNQFMETVNVVAGTNATAAVFNANSQQFGPAAPRPTWVLPAQRRTDAQTDPDFGQAAKGPGEYPLARDLTWSSAANAFYVTAADGLYKLTADGQSSTFVGDPGVDASAITFFNIDGQRRLLVGQENAGELITINPATGEVITSVPIFNDTASWFVAGLLSLVESPDTNTLIGLAKDSSAPNDPLKRKLIAINPVDGAFTEIGTVNAPVDDLAFVYSAAAAPAARVTEAYVRGSAWAGSFKQYLEAKGLGDDAYGYKLFGPGRTAPAANPQDILPWINANEVVLKYSSAPTGSGVPTQGSVTVTSTKGINYTVSSVTPVAGDPTAFVVQFNQPLGGGDPATGRAPTASENGDHVTISVPGAGAGGFSLRMDVLQGDVDHTGETGATHNVLANDFSAVKKKFFKNTNDAATGADTDYSAFHDVNGSGDILANDFSEVKKRFFQELAPPPAALSPLAAASISSEMFGQSKILA